MRRKFCSRRRRGCQGRARAGRGGARQAGGRPSATGPAAGWGRGRVRASVREGGRRVAGRAAGTMWASPSGGPCGARATARGQVAGAGAGGRARLALPSRPRLRPTRVPAALGAPGPAGAGASFLSVSKVAPGPSASGLEDARGPEGGRPGAGGPDGPSFCLGAARPPPTVGRRRQEGVRGSGRRGESGTQRVRSTAAAARGSRDPRWQYLASVGSRRESNLSWDQGGEICIKQSPGCVYSVNLLREDSCLGSRGRKLRIYEVESARYLKQGTG